MLRRTHLQLGERVHVRDEVQHLAGVLPHALHGCGGALRRERAVSCWGLKSSGESACRLFGCRPCGRDGIRSLSGWADPGQSVPRTTTQGTRSAHSPGEVMRSCASVGWWIPPASSQRLHRQTTHPGRSANMEGVPDRYPHGTHVRLTILQILMGDSCLSPDSLWQSVLQVSHLYHYCCSGLFVLLGILTCMQSPVACCGISDVSPGPAVAGWCLEEET